MKGRLEGDWLRPSTSPFAHVAHFPGKLTDEDDNTKAEAAKMQKEYELLKDSTKNVQAASETSELSTQFRSIRNSNLT